MEASFVLSHIDRMPLGDINSTIHMLITMNTLLISFIHTHMMNGHLRWIPENLKRSWAVYRWIPGCVRIHKSVSGRKQIGS